jgi:ABC-2 type transport system ATP-binding protein
MSVSVNIEKITKTFGDVTALNSTTLQIDPGELFGFIGPDGAGKTTLFRILTSLLLPDTGKASVGGLDVVKDYKKVRNLTGYMPGRFSLYGDLSVEENMEFYASIFHTTLEENYDLVKDIYSHIEPFKKRKAKTFRVV